MQFGTLKSRFFNFQFLPCNYQKLSIFAKKTPEEIKKLALQWPLRLNQVIWIFEYNLGDQFSALRKKFLSVSWPKFLARPFSYSLNFRNIVCTSFKIHKYYFKRKSRTDRVGPKILANWLRETFFLKLRTGLLDYIRKFK